MTAVRVDVPVAGYYKTRLVKNGIEVGVRIWYGQPLDPVTKDPLDRSHRWCATRDGEIVDVFDVWPGVSDKRISEQDFNLLVATRQWATAHAPHLPEANPRKPIDLNSMASIF